MIRNSAIPLIVLLLLLKVSRSVAQETDYNNYQPMRCEGPAPEDFTKPSYQKFYSEAADIKKAKDLSKGEKKLQKEFSLITNFKIDDMLMSGKVLYGNKVCNYVNDVADRLIKNKPELKGKVRFYVLNVSYANAISTKNGIIFITTGLLARLKNEAQLAFVLSHEIAHFTLNHSYESFKNTVDVLGSKRYDNLETEDKVLRILKYSKNNESEADIEGLELFSKAGYDKREAIGVMDVLLYSHLPYDEIVFPKTFFNDEYYEIPAVFFRDTASEIEVDENEEDEESSHPNVGFRKLKLEKFIKGDTNGIVYAFDKSLFDEVVRTCRYELGYLLIVRGYYEKAFYNAYLLTKNYGENAYTAELMSASLYGINKNKLDEDFKELNEILKDNHKKEMQGQISMVDDFFDFLKSDEFNVLAAKIIYKNAAQYPTKYHQNLVLDVFTDLYYAHKYDWESFNTTYVSRDSRALNSDDFDESDDNDDSEESSTKKKKSKKKKKKPSKSRFSGKSNYFKNAFVAEYADESFVAFVEAVQKKVAKIKKDEEDFGLEQLRSEPRKRYRQWISDELALQKKNGKRLGVDSLILIAPSYKAYFVNRDGTEVKTDDLSDELKAIDITDAIKAAANSNELTLDLIDINSRSMLNDSQLNRFSLIGNWMSEKYSHTDKRDVMFTQKYIDGMVADGSYKYAAVTGVTYTSSKREISGQGLVLGIMFVYTIPLVIAHVCDTRKELNYYYLVYNLETGEEMMLSLTKIRRRPHIKIIKMQYAYIMYQTKAKRRNK